MSQTAFMTIIAVGVYLVEEVVAAILFYVIRRTFRTKLESDNQARSEAITIFKGMLERLFIYVGLILGYSQCLTVFAALKIGTRLEDAKSTHVSNDYFLIGNLLSVLLALIAYYTQSKVMVYFYIVAQ